MFYEQILTRRLKIHATTNYSEQSQNIRMKEKKQTSGKQSCLQTVEHLKISGEASQEFNEGFVSLCVYSDYIYKELVHTLCFKLRNIWTLN